MKRVLYIFFAIVGLSFLWYLITIPWGNVVFCCDNLLIQYPSQQFFWDSIRRGIFPLWNPYIFSGTPFFADINLNLLYPLNVLYAMVNPFVAMTLIMSTNIGVAFVGMYISSRAIGISKSGAIVSAALYALSGTLLTYTNNIGMLQVAALLPWLVWAVHQYGNKKTFGSYILAVSVGGLQMLAGHPQLTFYSWLFIGVFMLWRFGLVRGIALTAKVGVGMVLLTAVQLVPFIEFVFHSFRSTLGFAYATFDSVSPLSLVRLVLPTVTGDTSNDFIFWQGGSIYGYIGALSLFLIVFRKRKTSVEKFFFWMSVGSLLLALGKYTPVYWVAYYLVWGIGKFRSPSQFLLIYTYCMAISTGLVLSDMGEIAAMFRTRTVLFLTIALLVISMGLFVVTNQVLETVILHLGSQVPALLPKLTKFPVEIWQQELHLIRANIQFIAVSFLLIVILCRRHVSLKILTIILSLILIVDVWLYGRHALITTPLSVTSAFQDKSSVTASLSRESDTYKIYTDQQVFPNPYAPVRPSVSAVGESVWQSHILRPNLNMVFGIPSVDGYASLVFDAYVSLVTPASTDPTGIALTSTSMSALNLLGVKRILTKPEIVLDKPYANSFVTSDVSLYESPVSETKFKLLKSDNKDIFLYNAHANGATLTVSTTQDDVLIFRNTFYPGWVALLDGKRVPIVPYENIFMSLPIPSGDHDITFVYAPLSHTSGLVITLISICYFVVLGMRYKKIQLKQNV